MTNKEAIEILKTESCADCSCHPETPMSCINTKCPLAEATLLAIKALKILDDANYKIYRNESCDRAGKCDDYIGWHCTGCNRAKEEES